MVNAPKVSIGIPVYNGENTIANAIESIIQQTFTDFELIIADNASTDDTESICKKYLLKDKRIKYVRHQQNMGGGFNLKFLLENSSGEYFMWAAVDDVRSLDFLDLHVGFLDENPSYVSSTSPTAFDGKDAPDGMMGDWGLEQNKISSRMILFFSCWHANGHFYGLHRRACVVSWPELYGHSFHGADWTLVIHLAALGKLHRASSGWVKLGSFGVSAKKNLFACYRKGWLDYLIPFRQTSCKAIRIVKDATMLEFVSLVIKLVKFNMKGLSAQLEHDAWDHRVHKAIKKLCINNEDVTSIVICGAGIIGRRLYGTLDDLGINAKLFTDKGLCGGSLSFDGVSVPVVNISSALDCGFKYFIVASDKYAEEISSELKSEANVRNVKIYISRLFY